jgi:micrococcal nuclease
MRKILNTPFSLIFFIFISLSSLAEPAFIKRVVDGDTLHLRDGRKIRLIGIDTPEIHKSHKLDKDAIRSHQDKKTIQELGKRSSDFVKRLIQSKHVEIKTDPLNSNPDKYGRTLAYIWFDCSKPPTEYLQYLKIKDEPWIPQKLMLNRVLIQCGYANAYTNFPFQHLDDFRDYERTARENKLGLWAPIEGLKQTEEPKEKTPKNKNFPNALFLASKKSKVYHPANCPHVTMIKSNNLMLFKNEEEAIANGKHPCKK